MDVALSQNIPSVRTFLKAGSRRKRARNAVRLVTPVGVELLLISRRHKRRLLESDANIVRDVPPAGTRVEQAIRLLVGRGLDEDAVRQGSIPEDSLNYIRDVVSDRLPSDRPVRVLHVGNFVGVSLCYVSWLVRERHPESLVVSVDPNIIHCGVEDTQSHVFALLHHFGLLGNNLVIPGYTLERTSRPKLDERFQTDYLTGLACEDVLATLARLCGKRFDLVLLDGNHDEDYLAREFASVGSLLAENGIVVFDDVSADWEGVVRVFSQALQDGGFVELGRGGRVGILQVGTTRGEVVPAPALGAYETRKLL
jgi:hypothetical protein